MPAATAAADPEEEPPGVCSRLRGLRVREGVKLASSVVTVLPRMTAPAARRAATQAASLRGWRPLYTGLPCSVGRSAVSMMSLMPTGTPCRAPTPLPSRRCASAAVACAKPRSRSRKAQALSCGSSSAIRARQAVTRACEVRSPLAIRGAASLAVSAVKSALLKVIDPSMCAATGRRALCRSPSRPQTRSFAIEIVRQPEGHPGPKVHDDHAQDDHQHVGHHATEDLIERDVRG